MAETKCLICNLPSPGSPPNPRSSNILADQLSAIFLLRNVFELPSWTIQKYLISSGGKDNPSQWLSVCRECDHLVKKTKTFYDQFLEADRTFRRAKYELVQKMKKSLPPGFTNCNSISEECRQIVKLHDYAEPPKNPFKEGDHRARELLGVAVDFDVTNLNVKMEAFESTEENQLDLDLVNRSQFDHQHHNDMDLACSQDLSLTPEGHDYDDSDGGGGDWAYHDDDNPNDSDEDYEFHPPGPKCRKREAKSKSCKTMSKIDPETRNDEISAAEASSLVQFMTTFRSKRMVRYDGHDFLHSCRKPSSTGVTVFNCKWRRDGCPARVGLRNYNEEDATFSGFLANLEPHDHSAATIRPGHTKHAIWFEVNSLAKEIVKDNVNAPTGQILQMVLDSFMGDPEVSEELKKKNAHRNLSRVIRNMKRRLGWKWDPNVRPDGTSRRRFLGTTMKIGESEGDDVITEQAPTQDGDEIHPEVKTDLVPFQTDVGELTFDQASILIQFMATARGNRMVRFDGHNFYRGGHKPTTTGLTHFNCRWRQQDCLARISLRNYNDADATFTGFIPNSESHRNHSESGNFRDRTKHGIWFEVNSLAKEIVKDNVNTPTGQILQMVLDSFMGDPEVSEELKKKNAHRNLSRVIRNMKRRLGWKWDPNVRPDGTARRRFLGTTIKSGESEGDDVITEQAPTQNGDEIHPEVKTDLVPSQTDVGELTFDQASILIQFMATARGNRMVRFDGHNFYFCGHKPTSTGLKHLNCRWRQQDCLARISLGNYNDADATFTGFIPNSEPHRNHPESGNFRDRTKHAIWYEINSLAKEIVKDNVNAPAVQVFQMIQDSFMGDPQVTEELSKFNVQRSLKRVIRTMKRQLGWKPDPTVRQKRIGTKKRTKGVAKANPIRNDNQPLVGQAEKPSAGDIHEKVD